MFEPSETALVSLETVKQWMDIAPDDTGMDQVIDSILIPNVSGAISSLLNRRYYLYRTYTELVNGNGHDLIIPQVTPVESVVSLSINDEVIDAAAGHFDDGYLSSDNCIVVRGRVFDTGYSNVSVTYTAGWQIDSIEFYALKQAVYETINLKWHRRERPDLIRQDLGNQITASFSAVALPAEVTHMIQHLRKVTPNRSRIEIVP